MKEIIKLDLLNDLDRIKSPLFIVPGKDIINKSFIAKLQTFQKTNYLEDFKF